jgi:hypothetical protein
MQEVLNDIWKLHKLGFWIVIPTNGFIRNDGTCVMGRGLALQASIKFPNMPKELGNMLQQYGNLIFAFPEYRLFTFPVKYNWWEKADLDLIKKSCKGLVTITHYNWSNIPKPVYIPRVGCGNGKLNYNDVKPILEENLNNDFTICSEE